MSDIAHSEQTKKCGWPALAAGSVLKSNYNYASYYARK